MPQKIIKEQNQYCGLKFSALTLNNEIIFSDLVIEKLKSYIVDDIVTWINNSNNEDFYKALHNGSLPKVHDLPPELLISVFLAWDSGKYSLIELFSLQFTSIELAVTLY